MSTPTTTGVIAIDGPAGTGKSTVSQLLAARIGGHYLDTGAMYRTVTLAVLQAGVDPADPAAVTEVARAADVRAGIAEDGTTRMTLDGSDVSSRIREDDVTAAVSAVSAVGTVRDLLLTLQRQAATEHLLVVEGRDIGTVVFPNALVKIFLTAAPEVRAERRYQQQRAAGRPADLAEILAAVNRRDHLDSTREIAPLRAADDAIRVDTSDLTRDEVVDRLAELVDQRIGAKQ